MRRSLRRKLFFVLTLVAFAGAGPGCSKFYSTKSYGTEITWVIMDQRLPNAISELSNTCHRALTLTPSTDSIDLRGTCGAPDDLPTIDGQNLFAALATAPELEVDLPSELPMVEGSFAGFKFPLQSCRVSYDADPILRKLKLRVTAVRWVRASDGMSPTLQIDWAAPVGSFEIANLDLVTRKINCNQLQSIPVVAALIPKKAYAIKTDGLRVTTTFEMIPKDRSGIETQVLVGASLGTLTAVDNEHVTRLAESAKGQLEAGIAYAIRKTTGPATDALDSFVNRALAAQKGKIFCSASLQQDSAYFLTVNPSYGGASCTTGP